MPALPASSEWKKVAFMGDAFVYVDQKSIRREGQMTFMYILDDNITPKIFPRSDLSFISTVTLAQFDCAAKKSRVMFVYVFGGPMRTGRLVSTIDELTSWSAEEVGTPTHEVWKAACGVR